MKERNAEIHILINKYKLIPKRDYYYNSHNFIENLITFYKEKRYLSNKQLECLKSSINILYDKEQKYKEKYNDFNLIDRYDFELHKNKFLFYTKEIINVLEKIINKFGVYFIHNENEEIIYVGKSVNLGSRIKGSLEDKKGFGFSCLATKTHIDACLLEIYYIAKYNPIFNKEPLPIDNISKNIKITHKYKMSNIYMFQKYKEELDEMVQT